MTVCKKKVHLRFILDMNSVLLIWICGLYKSCCLWYINGRVWCWPAEHIQLNQEHFSTYEQWPVKCCCVHSWYYYLLKQTPVVFLLTLCCSVAVLLLFYRKRLKSLLTLLILFACSTSKTVVRDIKAFFFCNVLHLRCTYFSTLLNHAGYLLKEWLTSFSPISPNT